MSLDIENDFGEVRRLQRSKKRFRIYLDPCSWIVPADWISVFLKGRESDDRDVIERTAGGALSTRGRSGVGSSRPELIVASRSSLSICEANQLIHPMQILAQGV